MNTLQELNNYSNSQIPFEDDRSLIITVGNTTTTTQSVTVAEDAPVDLSTFGVTFSELRSLDDATADHITLTFDFSAATNPTVVWPDKTAYVEGNTRYNNITFSNPSTGVFVADNIQLNTDYLAVLANTDIIARDQSAVYSYTITVSWPGNSYTQQFDVTTTPAGDETNLNGLALTARSLFQHLLFDPSLTPAPAIVDASPNSTYSLQLTSTLGATLSATLGGTPTTSITLTGDKDTLTTAIQTVYYTPIAGAWNTTDTLNYTLEVTNGTAGVYTSETGSFTNYIPIFASISGITSTTTNSSVEVDLFAAPYPTITGNITSNLININITTTYGEVKESSTTGSWGNSLVLTGSLSSLETQLQGVQYRPEIDPANPIKTDILSYTMTYQAFTLDSGSWSKQTTIDTVVSNITGRTVSDIGVADLFSAPLPTVTSTDTNTQYDFSWNYNAGRATISPNINGSPSTIQTGLQAATFEPLVQDTTVNVAWTLTLRGVVWQTGTFAMTVDEFFTLNDMPNSIDFSTQSEYTLFAGITAPTLVDNTGNGYTLAFTFDASGLSTPGSFNSGSGSSVTYTGIDTAINSNIASTSYNTAIAPLVETTETIAYTLVYNGITWISGTLDFVIPPQITIDNSSIVRSYIQNTKVNSIFINNPLIFTDNTSPPSPRNLTLEFNCSAGFATLNNSSYTYPYVNPFVLGPATLSQFNSIISDINTPFIYIPAAGSTTSETITITVKDGTTVVGNATISLAGVARTTNIVGEGIYSDVDPSTTTINVYYSGGTPNFSNVTIANEIPITEEMFLFCSMDVLAISGGGSSTDLDSTLPSNPQQYKKVGGWGGDGGFVELDNVPLSRFDDDTINFNGALTLSTGYGGELIRSGSGYGFIGGDGDNTIIDYKKDPGTGNYTQQIANIITVYGGGGANTGANGNNGGGGAGGGAERLGTASTGITYNTYSGGNGLPALTNNTYIQSGEITHNTSRNGFPGTILGTTPTPGDNVAIVANSDITGTSMDYRAEGGYPGIIGAGYGEDGLDGILLIRIAQR